MTIEGCFVEEDDFEPIARVLGFYERMEMTTYGDQIERETRDSWYNEIVRDIYYGDGKEPK